MARTRIRPRQYRGNATKSRSSKSAVTKRKQSSCAKLTKQLVKIKKQRKKFKC